MSGYIVTKLGDYLNVTDISEVDLKKYLNNAYACPLNKDIEVFLGQKAIEFEKHGISRTYLVYASYKQEYVLAGYFSLAQKVICIDKGRDINISKTLKKRLGKFAIFDNKAKRYCIPIPLIGQLGKNYSNGFDSLISGDELLKLALDKISLLQTIVGGKMVYVECEPKETLIQFYSRNGFVKFAERKLDPDETNIDGEYLTQMIRYMK